MAVGFQAGFADSCVHAVCSFDVAMWSEFSDVNHKSRRCRSATVSIHRTHSLSGIQICHYDIATSTPLINTQLPGTAEHHHAYFIHAVCCRQCRNRRSLRAGLYLWPDCSRTAGRLPSAQRAVRSALLCLSEVQRVGSCARGPPAAGQVSIIGTCRALRSRRGWLPLRPARRRTAGHRRSSPCRRRWC